MSSIAPPRCSFPRSAQASSLPKQDSPWVLALLHAPVLPDELNPSREALVHAAGEIAALLAQGDYAKALDAFPQFLKDYPDVPYLHDAYAKALAAAGRITEALEQRREESASSESLAP